MSTRDGPDEARDTTAIVWTAAFALAVIGLTALAIGRRWSLLADTPFPVGIDGYFYPIQLRALLDRGELAYADFPLAFYLLAPFAATTDPIVGAKLGAAVLGGLAVVPACLLGVRLGGTRGAGVLAGAVVATSAGGAFLAMEFVKNGVGVTVALTAMWLVLRALDAPRLRTDLTSAGPHEDRSSGKPPSSHGFSRQRIALAVAGIVAAAATHKLALALVLLVAAPATLAAFADRGLVRGRRLIYATIGLVVGGAAALAILGGIGHALGALSREAEWSAPALRIGPRFVLAMGHEALLGALAALAVAVPLALDRRPRRPRAIRAVGWTFVVLAFVFALPWLAVDDPQGIGFRLRVVAFVPLALLAALAFAALPARIGGVVSVVAAGAIVIAAPARRDEGRVVPHPAMIASVSALAEHVPATDTVIIPERHVMFMAVWYARVHAQMQPQGVPPERRWRAITLSFIRADSALDRALMAARRPDRLPPGHAPPVGLHPSHPNGFVLVREDTWQLVVSRLPPPERTRAAAWPTL